MKLLMVFAFVTHLIFPGNDRREAIEVRDVNSITVDSAWQNQTDWCEITLPRNVRDFEKRKVNEVFRRGDEVIVNIGINGIYREEFRGYVTEVSADIPIKIKCEDEMWQLKKLPVNISLDNTTLPSLMQAILPGYQVDAMEVNLGTVRFSKTRVSEVLEKLNENFGLHSFFRNGQLRVGKIYTDDNAIEHEIHLEKDIVSNDLKFLNAQDRLIKITAVSTLPNGDKFEVQVGDEDGEERQLTFFNIDDETELTKLAEIEYEKYKVDGFEGDINCFGNVTIEHGDIVHLVSDKYPERNGSYYADKKYIRFLDAPSYRKAITLGPRKVV